jgi:ribonuclease G
MSKEMIISVNGREKKIAILENGQVTEFYIERDEDNSGVVGNIYKGRVQRVLPGMQSAFVDIGLERDAFLYVSDFFDEEEEIERIVMEKAKEKKSEDELERETTDELHKSRLKRDKQIDNKQEKAESVGDNVIIDDSDDDDDKSKDSRKKPQTRRRRRGQKPTEDKSEEKTTDDGQADDKDKKKTSRGRRKKQEPVEKEETKDDQSDSKSNRKTNRKTNRKPKQEKPAPRENVLDASDLDFGDDSSFERIVDEEAETGEMLKDAMMQEAITHKVRAIEFDMESTDSAEVGSLIDSVTDAGSGFERIADEDEEGDKTEDKPKPKRRQSRRSTSRSRNKTAKKDNAESEENKETEEKSAPKTRSRKASSRKKTTTSRSRKKKEEPDVEAENKDDDKTSETANTAKKTTATRKKSTRAKTTRTKKPSTRRKTTAKSKSKATGKKQVADAEASVKESTDVAEMAVRRGSRGGRRRTTTSSGRTPAKTDTHKDKSYKTTEAEKTITADNAIASAEFKSKSRSPKGRGRRSHKPQPKITDLLHEGQEILVQIAKEPIARKGARITSHIALPGRFLVYMPTIEHLGVSRKIESSKERSRLRGLLQNVMQKEDIPSGGFIVRTAGTNKSEQELREDARYLTKTWNELRKDSEKSKSPQLIHQDLDIVQRLLRDHLSEDFTAIRVDSEEEYLRIIEFINRIQPKMVKRVKFHTLDEPILDTYGVSDEIDKALKHRVWLRSGGYLVINQTEALIAIDVNTGKFVGKGNARLEDTITKTNMEAVQEISRQIRLRDLGGIIVLDLIDMEDRNNRKRVLTALQNHLSKDKSPTKVLSFNDFGLIIMTRKRVKQSLERTLCSPCSYCDGAGWIKSASTICYEILVEARRLSKGVSDVRQTTLRVHPAVAETLRNSEKEVLEEIEDYLGVVDLTGDSTIHQEQFDFAFI